jgi:hypothetical protein
MRVVVSTASRDTPKPGMSAIGGEDDIELATTTTDSDAAIGLWRAHRRVGWSGCPPMVIESIRGRCVVDVVMPLMKVCHSNAGRDDVC